MRICRHLALLVLLLGTAPTARAAVFSFSASFVNGGQLENRPFQLWLPDDPSGPPGATAPVKGLVFLLPGAADDWRSQVQERNLQQAASALGFGLIGANSMFWGPFKGETAGVVTSVLDAAAVVSGRPELANAPFAALGVSQGGFNATRIALAQPDRAIAFVNIRGGYSHDGSAPISETLEIMGLSIVASKDSIVHPGYGYDGIAVWRSLGAPHAFAVEWNTTHFDTRRGQTWDVAWHWIGEAARLRYPNAGPLSTAPGERPVLADIDTMNGWVGHAPQILLTDNINALVPTPTVEVASIAGGTFSEPIQSASWLPSSSAAHIYQTFTSFDGLSRPITPRQGPLHFLAPQPVTDMSTISTPLFEVGDIFRVETEVQPYDTFINGIALTAVDYYLDEQFLGTVVGDNNWQLDVTFTKPGIHALLAIGRDAAGKTYPAFRTVLVAPPIPEPTTLCATSLMAAVAFATTNRRQYRQRCASPRPERRISPRLGPP
jgi:pimeloyl-ACP methyl ester carboxylesterase